MDTTQSISARTIIIKDIQLRTRARRKLPVARQFYIQFSVGETSRSTNHAKEAKNHTSWDNTFHFDGDDGSVFLVKVYQRHRFGVDTEVGTLMDTVGGALGRLKDGVLQGTFQDTSDQSDLSGITMNFALATEPRRDVTADKRQAMDAVTRATTAVNPLDSTSAAVGLLASVVDNATNIQTFENVWAVLLQRLKLFDGIVTDIAKIHPYASLAWSVISAAEKVLVNQKNRDDKIVRLAGTMSDVLSFVHDAEPLKTIKAHVKTITLLIQQVTECGYFVTEYANQRNFWIRTTKYLVSDIDTMIMNYENKFRELKSMFLEGVSVQTEITVIRMMDIVKDAAESIVLDDMPYAFGARYQPEKGCLPGTRESLLREICDILSNAGKDAPRVCLLTGVAGSGKSSVAHSIARLYAGQNRLGSSYCFAITDVANRNPKNLFTTIARDLADRDPQYKFALWQVVKDDRALRTSQSPMEQAESLIIQPTKDLHPIGPLVIVIDALDESGNQAGRRQLLRVLSEQIADNTLPNHLRFLITARPEKDILDALPPGPQLIHKQMGNIPDYIVDEDIEKFIYHSLHRYTELEYSWPNQQWCQLLVRHSQQLFQWASTACNFIEGEGTIGLDPQERLYKLLQSTSADGGRSLDDLYETILSQLFTLDDTRERFREVMAIILGLNEPLSLTSLSALFGEDINIRAIIKPMGSLLDGVIDGEKPIRSLHTSFHEFLLDKTRSSIFHVHILPQHSLQLARALLACMREMLRFNICDLKDSRIRNASVPNLPSQVKNAIPPHLAYSCQYWMHHLQHIECTPDLLNEVTHFFKTFLPFWLEAISLLSLISPISPILSALETCTILNKWANDQELVTLAIETFQFIQVFAPILKESTPHLYLSAMPQIPSSSSLHSLWLQHLQEHVLVRLGHPVNWPADVHTMQGHTGPVNSIAYSPNGKYIVSGSADRTIRIWNAITGQCEAGPFEGHAISVSSVAYAPDGVHIVSGSWDNTIRVWDSITGQLVAGPLEGHTDNVYSVAYAPDGIHIVSGSRDKTIRVWDSITGQLVAGPLEGHTDIVTSVAYAPDGVHIVSGSRDKTIRVWDSITGQLVAGPLEGHTDIVTSVAYAPDGVHIVSGSWDNTIRVWDSITGQLVAGPLEGHADFVSSVAYAPDGIHIISGSWDNTIRVWNSITGQLVTGPLEHADSVTSVAYAPDGVHIVSGSWDNTIRVWDSITGQLVAGPLEGHTDNIWSVAYAPDGIHIVSGSWDKTIRVWDSITGQLVTGPLEGHAGSVSSVAYAPDGVHIVSGSQDNTIRVWDSITGQLVAGPLEGHTDIVTSVAYAPDGVHIVSGSRDKTIRVWDSITGQLVAGPLEGHTDIVTSVAYAPDGVYIVSGSWDNTIRVWDSITGQLVAGPLEGHTDHVTSVAYAPDGVHIVSGSWDNTIRIWDSITGQLVVGPLEGHADFVSSVAYAPDGIHIVSGSWDETIRVWDSITGQLVAGPLEGHAGFVSSVAYAPDGIHIVSASDDNTIRVWNATTAQCVAGPIQGHANSVASVSYSPNGNYIVSGSEDHSIKVWKVQDLFSFGNLNEQGSWLQSSDGACFGWIAPWNRNSFHLPVHSLVIASNRVCQVDSIDNPFYGEPWSSCWH